MPDSRRLPILGGTEEARQLPARPGVVVITSLAGRTVAPLRPTRALRIGGFGGAEGLPACLGLASIDLVRQIARYEAGQSRC